ncbi:type 1 glutamine amidotransferase [Mesorhizobium sp.]|uniref:type 1 glutamine amidotransferase n=1 Tax=Mesorhizobium sp. TaxID=1871066 RepID=UPI000FE6609E|nr:type 1 glutamine amidotransferase [Mesorhizobium sp.]RWM38708.1 MAG: type 1 glutamine amidotransferase [Mesorhizobium sp.]
MRMGILQTGRTPEQLIGQFGDYDQLFSALLDGGDFNCTTYKVVDGQFPVALDAADGWLITGSKSGVNDGQPWIARLEALVREIFESEKPLIGICFGHQLVAKALGGTVERSSGGWIVGPTAYLRNDLGLTQTLLAWHQDQVTRLPTDAAVLASSEDCAYSILRYGERALTYQAHPEFGAAFIKGLVKFRGAELPAPLKKHANSADDAMICRKAIRAEIRSFLLRQSDGWRRQGEELP